MTPDQTIASGALWLAIPLAALAGLISFASPCVLPLVPGYLGFIAADSSATDDPKRARHRLLAGVLLFIAGFTLVFVTAIVLSSTFGVFFTEYNDLLTRVFGVLIIVLGLVFVGLFGFAQREVKPIHPKRAGLVGAPLLGIALGLGWAPCMGPTLAAIMSVSWNLQDPGRAALLGIAYSLGLGIPFLLLAAGFGWATSAAGFLRRHIRAINILGGIVLIVLGVLMVTGLWSRVMVWMGGLIGSVNLPL